MYDVIFVADDRRRSSPCASPTSACATGSSGPTPRSRSTRRRRARRAEPARRGGGARVTHVLAAPAADNYTALGARGRCSSRISCSFSSSPRGSERCPPPHSCSSSCCSRCSRSPSAARPLHRQGLRLGTRRPGAGRPRSSSRSSGSSYRLLRVDPEARAALDGVRDQPRRVQPRVDARALRHHAAPGAPAVEPHARRRRVSPHLSFDTSVSFVTNTNWQSYGGENTMSHLTSIGGLMVQHFASAAVGLAVVGRADPRHLAAAARRSSATSGSTSSAARRASCCRSRSCSRSFLGSQGVIANFHGFTSVTTVEGVKQLIPGGPVAGWMAIKQLGSNGGGFFNANSAHPFENPRSSRTSSSSTSPCSSRSRSRSRSACSSKDKRQGRMVLVDHGGRLGRRIAVRAASPRPTATRASPRSAPTSRSAPTRAAATWKARTYAPACRRRAVWGASVTLRRTAR